MSLNTDPRGRVAAYLSVSVLLLVGYTLLRDSSWQGTKQLHTIMEIIATLLASAVGVLALIRFYSRKNNTILFIGTAFLGTAFLDGYHAIVTSSFFDIYFPSPPPSLIPWSWIASRLFLAVFLYLSYLAWRREQSLGEAGRFKEVAVYQLAAVLTVVSFIFFAFTPLPRAYYPEFVFHRPEEFFPAIFFLLALICYLKKGEWRHDHFEHWLVMSIIVGFMGQVMFMSFSGHLFDFMFDAAHLLKKVSYVLVLTGLLISIFHLFRQAEKNARELEVSADELREANERLEIAGRIARDVGSSLHEKDLFPTIAREIRRIIPCERLFIGSVNFETEEVYYWHIESDVEVPQVDGDDASRLEWYRELYEKSFPLIYGDLRKVPYRRAQDFANAGILSQLVVPIERDGQCVAHLALSSTRVNAFSSDQVEQLISLSGHINVALQNSMLFQAAEERAERLEIVGEIARAVGSELEPSEVFTTVINEIRNVVPCDRIVIACLDPEKESYDWYHYFEHEDVQKNSDTYEQMGRGLIPRKAYFEKQPYIIPDLAEKPWRDSLHFKRGYRSTIVIPILQENRCVAHLQLSSRETGAFSKAQESLLTSIASQLGGAIRNATLFQEAERSRDFLDSVIRDNADAIFIYNTDREIIDWNLGAENLYGYRKDEMLGKSVGILLPEDGTDPSQSERVLQTDAPVIFEANRLKKDGSLVPVSITNSPVRNKEGNIIALSAVHKDLTMQVAAEEEIRSLNANLEKHVEEVNSHAQRLELSEAQFRALFNSSQDAVIAIDEEGFVTLFNQAAEKMFEYTSDDIVGRKINLLMPSPYSEEHDAHLNAYRLTGVRKAIGFVRTLEGRSKSGKIFPIELSVGEVVVGDKQLFTGILRDITERHEIDRMKNEFISVVSHEIRTPLTSLRGSLGLMAGGVVGELTGQGEELLAIAVNNTDRLIRLISDILDLEKIESGKMELQISSIHVEELIDRAMEEMRGLAEESGIEIEKKVEACLVDVDSDAVIQILANLISNALKFSEPGSRISLATRCLEAEAEIRVEDNGRGIPPGALDGIFDRFRQVDSSDQREKGGTGLGLAICSAIVTQHGGRIWVESEPGEGSIFFFTLPRTELAPVRVSAPRELIKPSVLVCEDDIDFVCLMKVILENEGYFVIPTFSAEEALAYLEENEVAAVVLDINLPGMSGIDLLNEIKGYPEGRRPPAIVLSVEERVEIPDLPAPFLLDWITKPLDETRLLSRLKAAIKLGKPATALVVDDDPDLCSVVTRLLENRNIRVETAANGFEAVDKFREMATDLLILDIVMPGGDGFYVMDILRDELELRKIPIIVYSASEPTAADRKRLATETTMFLTKLKTSQDDFVGHVVEMLNGLLPDASRPE